MLFNLGVVSLLQHKNTMQVAPVMRQPLPGAEFLNAPLPLGPLGLNYLSQLDQIFVMQKIDPAEVFLACDRRNRYVLNDSEGRKLWKVQEENRFCSRNLCGPLRPFEIFIRDCNNQIVIYAKRPWAIGCCWFPGSLHSIEIFSPTLGLLGSLQQERDRWNAQKFVIKNEGGDPIFKVVGPRCPMYCCGDVEFTILSLSLDNEIGKISKKWSTMMKDLTMEADYFGITFPLDLDVKLKAVIIGATFLIDFMYFENSNPPGLIGKRNSPPPIHSYD